MKRLVTIIVVIIAAIGIAIAVLASRTTDTGEMSSSQVEAVLKVSPQSPVDTVFVDKVVIPKDGWVVARGIEAERLGQIIEISPFLTAGTHIEVTVPFGDFYNGEEVVLMLYEDNGDGVFNDLDLPLLNADGRMTAVYARSGEVLPANITAAGDTTMSHSMPGMSAMVQIRYTDEGYVPKRIEVPVGTMVEFVNESSRDMWVASDMHPTHDRLSTFDQFRPYGAGAVYRYTFDKAGIWPYHDHLAPVQVGELVVR